MGFIDVEHYTSKGFVVHMLLGLKTAFRYQIKYNFVLNADNCPLACGKNASGNLPRSIHG